MNIEKQLNEKKLDLKVSGRLDTTTAPDLEKELLDQLKDVEELYIDFSDLEYISSAGLRVLLIMLRSLKNRSGMTLRNVSDPVMDILENTGFINMIDNITQA